MRKKRSETTLWSTHLNKIEILKSCYELLYVLPGLIHIL